MCGSWRLHDAATASQLHSGSAKSAEPLGQDDVVDGLQAHRVQQLDVRLQGEDLVHREDVVHRLVPVGPLDAALPATGRVVDEALLGDRAVPPRARGARPALHPLSCRRSCCRRRCWDPELLPPELLPPTLLAGGVLETPRPPRVTVNCPTTSALGYRPWQGGRPAGDGLTDGSGTAVVVVGTACPPRPRSIGKKAKPPPRSRRWCSPPGPRSCCRRR